MATVATINECLAELKTLFDAALVDTYAKKVYDYRTLPNKLSPCVSLSYQGERQAGGTTGGEYGAYEIVAVLMVQVDQSDSNPETAQRNAEQALNTLENQLTPLLEKGGSAYSGDYWLKVDRRDLPSVRPPSPIEIPGLRWANVPFRLILGAMPD